MLSLHQLLYSTIAVDNLFTQEKCHYESIIDCQTAIKSNVPIKRNFAFPVWHNFKLKNFFTSVFAVYHLFENET